MMLSLSSFLKRKLKVSWAASEWKRPSQQREQNRPGEGGGAGAGEGGGGERWAPGGKEGGTDRRRARAQGHRRTHLPSWQS